MKWFLALTAATACLGYGQQICPWLNDATASGILESAAAATQVKNACEFKAKTGELRIEVSAMPDAERRFVALKKKCKSNRPLQAIGNEAFECSRGNAELVIGRVRNQVFTITLTMKGYKKEVLLEKVRLIAQEVSGAMF